MDQAQRLRERVNEYENRLPSTRVIAVTSGKGGVGKTSLSVNLAIALQKKGKKVVILDADFGLSNVEVMLGVRPQYNLWDLIYNDKSIDDIITKGPLDIGFISGGSGVADLVNLDKENIRILISKLIRLDKLYDVVIIDTGAGISDSVLEFVLSSPEVMLVVTPEPTSITDAYSLLKAVRQKKEFQENETVIKIVSNRVSNKREGKDIYDKLALVSSKFLHIPLQYAGYICDDGIVSKAIIAQKPVALYNVNSQVTKAFENIADDFLAEKSYNENNDKGIAKVFFDFIKSKKKGR